MNKPAASIVAQAAVPLPHDTKLFRRKVTLLLVSSLTIMSGATIAPSLPAIEAHFAETEHAALLTRLVLTVPALFIALCAPFAGVLADRAGRRPLLIWSIGLYAFAGMSGLLFSSLGNLLIGRALLGVAVAGTMTTATALIGDYFAGPERNRFMGLQSAFIGFGGLVFLTSGGVLAELHWRAPFAVYALALLLLPAVIAFIPEPARVAAGSGASAAASDSRIGTAIAALFAAAILNSVAFYLIPTQLPFHLQSIGAGTPSRAGLAIAILPTASALTALAYGRLRGGVGISITGMFGIGFGLMAAGFWLIAAADSYAAILAGALVGGVGMGCVMPNLGAAAMMLAPASMRGRVAGGLTASIFVGQFASPLISQPMIASFGYPASFRNTGLLLAAMALTAATLAFILQRRRPGAPQMIP